MTRASDCSPPALRRVRPPEAPVEGELFESGGEVRYRVAADDASSALWEAEAGGHLLAAVDLDRVNGVTMLVLPRLIGRVRVGDSTDAPTPGQAVTLAVSVLRGARAAGTAAWDAGEWWLADDGRPVLVPAGTTPAIDASIRLLDAIPASALGTAIVERAIGALREGDPAELSAVEDALFATAIPEPLGERLLKSGAGDGMPSPASAASRRTPSGEAIRPVVARLVDADLAERISGAWAVVRAALARRRVPPKTEDAPPAARGRMILVAGVVATVILALGLLWPQSDATEASTAPTSREAVDGAATPSPSDSEQSDGRGASVGTPPPDDASPPPDQIDRGSAAAATVDAVAACWRAGDAACRAELLERPDAAVPEGIATADARREVVLLDELGGVEVVRVDDPTGERRSQIVVLVVRDDKRLVRDVYDVADQP